MNSTEIFECSCFDDDAPSGWHCDKALEAAIKDLTDAAYNDALRDRQMTSWSCNMSAEGHAWHVVTRMAQNLASNTKNFEALQSMIVGMTARYLSEEAADAVRPFADYRSKQRAEQDARRKERGIC